MKSVARPIFAGLRCGTFATQASPRTDATQKTVPTSEHKLSRLPNGVVVASLEDHAPLSRVSVLYHAGSRHEPLDSLGVTHFVRAAANIGTKDASAFIVAKKLQQIGADLRCTTTRQNVSYTINCLRSDLSTGVSLLSHVVTKPLFKPWEVDTLRHRVKLDLQLYHQDHAARLIEKLHRTAYRDTLGQSLYVHEDCIQSICPATLESFVDSRYVSQGAAVVATGVNHDQLLEAVSKMTFTQTKTAALPETKKAKYYGGEARVHVKSPLVHAALVCEGAALSSPDLLTTTLLQLCMGAGGPFVQYGSNTATSKISKAALSATTSPYAAACMNVNYSDSGLFGCQVVASAKDIHKVLKSVMTVMSQATKGSVTEQDLHRAKNQLKCLIHAYGESSERVLESMGNEALLSGQLFPASAVDHYVDKITLDQVNNIAKKVINGKPTFVVVGDLTHTPYLDELMSRA